jgi:hypothetical protein
MRQLDTTHGMHPDYYCPLDAGFELALGRSFKMVALTLPIEPI